jgi:hypothetical protein
MKKILQVAINAGVPRSFLKRTELSITLFSSNVTGDVQTLSRAGITLFHKKNSMA